MIIIKDIINVCYVVTALYKKANEKFNESRTEEEIEKDEEKIKYLPLSLVEDKFKDTINDLIPTFSLELV
jgi:hypothetical protein